MEEDKYFLIYNSDGDTYIRKYSKKEIESELNVEESGLDEFMETLKSTDTNYWGNVNLLIKGRIVTPKEEKVIVKRVIE